jgi:hypothetical protein
MESRSFDRLRSQVSKKPTLICANSWPKYRKTIHYVHFQSRFNATLPVDPVDVVSAIKIGSRLETKKKKLDLHALIGVVAFFESEV